MIALQKLRHTQGRLVALDPEKYRLTLQGFVVNKTFAVASDAVIATGSQPQAALTDLPLGDYVDVYYADEGPEHIARYILPADRHAA